MTAHSSITECNFYGLHFGDYNFDGYLDIALNIRQGGNRDRGDFYYWLWDNSLEQFVFNEQLSLQMRNNGSIVIHQERQLVVSWFSHVGGRHHTYYKYEDGIFTPVEIYFWELYNERSPPENWNPPDGEFNVRFTLKDLAGGTQEIYYGYW